MVQFNALLIISALSAFVAAQGTGTQFITGPCTSDADCASGCCGFNSGKCAGAIVALERDGGCGRGSGTPNDNAARKLGFTGTFNPGTGNGNGNNAASSNTGNANGNANANMNANGNGNGNGNANANGNRNGNGNANANGNRNGNGNANANANSGAATGGSGAGGSGAATGTGSQFITGPCTGDSDCASGCCGFDSGKCAGPVIAQERDGGCGFGDSQPNDRAAQAFRAGQKRGLQYQWE